MLGRTECEFELLLEAGEFEAAERVLAADLGPKNIAAGQCFRFFGHFF